MIVFSLTLQWWFITDINSSEIMDELPVPLNTFSGHTHVAEALKVPIHVFFTMPWT